MNTTHFKVLKNISGAPNGGAGFNIGEVRPIADFSGCDLGWLQKQGAIIGCGPEPVQPAPVMASINGQVQPAPQAPLPSGAVNFGAPQAEYDAARHPAAAGTPLAPVLDTTAQWEELKAELAADAFKNMQALAKEMAETSAKSAAAFTEVVEKFRAEILQAIHTAADRSTELDAARCEIASLRESLAVYRTKCELADAILANARAVAPPPKDGAASPPLQDGSGPVHLGEGQADVKPVLDGPAAPEESAEAGATGGDPSAVPAVPPKRGRKSS